MVRLFVTLNALGPKRWILDGIVTGLAMLITAVWIVEHQVHLFAALGPGGAAGGVGAGIISLIVALDAALAGKPTVPRDMTATLRELDNLL
jgi:hypothetical protein